MAPELSVPAAVDELRPHVPTLPPVLLPLPLVSATPHSVSAPLLALFVACLLPTLADELLQLLLVPVGQMTL